MAANTAAAPYPIKINISSTNEFETIKTALAGNPDKYVSLDISGSTVTSIPTTAFANPSCLTLVGITLPNSIISIGSSAFLGCTNLAGITIPNSVTSIGGSAFSSCRALASATIGNSVRNIYQNAFSDTNSLTRVTFVAGGMVPSGGFSSTAFPGDLFNKYSATTGGGPGTYTRPAGGTTWTKQP
jgi:hypothetical protein